MVNRMPSVSELFTTHAICMTAVGGKSSVLFDEIRCVVFTATARLLSFEGTSGVQRRSKLSSGYL